MKQNKQPETCLVNKVICFQVLLRITNNSIKHRTFIYTYLTLKTVLLQLISV